jgi:hypothetical protein
VGVLRTLIRLLALLGFLVFCLRSAYSAEPPLRISFAAWTGNVTPGDRYSYTVAVFSNAEQPVDVEVTIPPDPRLAVLLDHRDAACAGTNPVICRVSIYADHPASATFTVQVRPDVCGHAIYLTANAHDTQGNAVSDRTGVSLIGLCRVRFPLVRK